MSTQAGAQVDPTASEAFRARVAAHMHDLAVRSLPPGDTLVTWTARGPVLFHTGARDSGGVRAGLLRNDRMLGLADVRWSAGTPHSFRTTWFTIKADLLDSVVSEGIQRDSGLVIKRSGTRDTTLALPSTAWAIADYGMEELLLPAFDSIGRRLPYRLAVLRPYGLKWDTLTVTERTKVVGRAWDVVSYTENDEQWRLAITPDSHLLWLRRSKHPEDEKRPLEGTALGATFVRLRPALESSTQPLAP
jgi:hypothetical protein